MLGFFSISGILGEAVYGLVYLVTLVVGFAISIITYFIAVILQMSNGVADSFAVQNGYSVMLSLVNLGFVLVIIIIAIATILKLDSYGVKKNLPRLIIAAILVNFGLLIGTTIINFSNALTTSFLSVVPIAGSGDKSAGYLEFADELASAFAPERTFFNNTTSQPPANNTANGVTSQNGTSANNNGNIGGDLGDFLKPLLGLISAAILLTVITMTLLAFLIMLLIRYVILAILLIVMPFAWLTWIFPNTKKNFSRWWNQFIKWTFFAPIVIFFLWLAIATAQSLNSAHKGNPLAFLQGTSGYAPNAANPIIGSGIMSSFIGSFLSTFAGAALQDLLIVGLVLGGIIAADKLSIVGASTAMGAMRSTGNSAVKYFGKQAKKGLRGTAQKVGVNQAAGRLQKSRIPLASILGSHLEGLTNKGGKDLVDEASKNIKIGSAGLSSMSKDQIVRLAQGRGGVENTFAILAEAQKKGILGELGQVGGYKNLAEFYLHEGKSFMDYGQGKLDKDISLAVGSRDMIKAAQARAQAEASTTINYGGQTLNSNDFKAKMQGIIDQSDESKDQVLINSGKQKAKAENILNASKKDLADFQTTEADIKNAIANSLDPSKETYTLNGKTVLATDALITIQAKISTADAKVKQTQASINAVEGTMQQRKDILESQRKRAMTQITAIENRVSSTKMTDTEGIAGKAGAQVSVGQFMEAATKKFVAGKSKKDISESKLNDLFKGKAMYGLNSQAVDAISRAILDELAVSAPSLASTIAGKIDNSKTLKDFYGKYARSLDKAVIQGKITTEEMGEILKANHQLKQLILSGYGGSGQATPTPTPP